MWPFVFAALALLVGSFQISLMNPAERIEVMLVDKNGELYSENGAHVDDYGESLPQQKNSICTSIRGSAECSLLKGELALKEKSFLLSKRWLDTLDIGSRVDSMDIQGRWYKGTVIKVDESKNELLIHFQGWRELYDEWLYRYSGKITKLGEKVKVKGSDMTTLLLLSGQTADFTPLFVEGLNKEERDAAVAFEEKQKILRAEMEKEAKKRKKKEKEKRKQKDKEKLKEKKQKEKKQKLKKSNEPEEKKKRTLFEELVDKLNDIVQTGGEVDEEIEEVLAALVTNPELDNNDGGRSPPARLENARRPKGSTPIRRWSQEEHQNSGKDALFEAKELKEYEKFLDLIRSGRVKKVDALDFQGNWWTGEITMLLADIDEVNISFDEWRTPFDEFIPISSGKLAPRKSRAKGGKLAGPVPGVPLYKGRLKSKAKKK